ncbi:MAG TPA: serine hydrolase [Gemmatimonadaceae bacterium]|nr:serine hydrolase [Gemmatimonadaceae bacterium]
MKNRSAIAITIAAVASACASGTGSVPQPHLTPVNKVQTASPSEVGMDLRLGMILDSIMKVGLAEHAAPGATLAVGRFGRLVHLKAYGRLDTAASSAAVDVNTMYDMASLTKVVATTTAAMMLEEQGLLDLDRTVASYLPGFNAPDKATITMRMVVEHRGGMEAFAALFKTFKGRDQYLEQINSRPLKFVPNTQMVYSDWDMILTGLVIEKLTGMTLDRFVAEKIFQPLGMMRTMFTPDASLKPNIAPTEVVAERGGLVWGSVHDENANAIGGVAGHAGLFSTAPDAAVFVQMLLNGGEYNGVRLLKPETVARWTSVQRRGSSRALGWDTPSNQSSAGHYFSPRSFGHTGFTGTSIWADPTRELFVVLLTNRVNPTRNTTRVFRLRRDIADAVQKSIVDAPLIDWESRK